MSFEEIPLQTITDLEILSYFDDICQLTVSLDRIILCYRLRPSAIAKIFGKSFDNNKCNVFPEQTTLHIM